MIRAKCTKCGRTTRASDDWAGRAGNCPNCGEEIVFPKIVRDQPPAPVERPYEPVALWRRALVFGLVAGWHVVMVAMGFMILYWTLQGIKRGQSIGIGTEEGSRRGDPPFGFWLETIVNLMLGVGVLALVFIYGPERIRRWFKRCFPNTELATQLSPDPVIAMLTAVVVLILVAMYVLRMIFPAMR